jgi:hypothetical protein
MTAQERYDDRDDVRDREIELDPAAGTPLNAEASREASPGRGGTADLIGQPARDGGSEPSGPVSEARETGREDDATPLLPSEGVERFQAEWERVQVGFVDEPRQAVQQADQLVAALMREMAEEFATARADLEAEWDRGEDVSTEDLRLALQRYRSFFQRLLAA